MKIIIAILTIIIITILFITYDKISQPEIRPITNIYHQKYNKSVLNTDFPKINFKADNFPARELFMQIDFKNYKNIVLYKVTIDTKDKYAIFNMKTILKNLGIVYSILETKKTEIYILFKSLPQANKIIKLFRSYHFDIKIKKIIKRM